MTDIDHTEENIAYLQSIGMTVEDLRKTFKSTSWEVELRDNTSDEFERKLFFKTYLFKYKIESVAYSRLAYEAFSYLETKNISLLFDISLELSNEDFLSFSHGSSTTYGEGCRGPLCRNARTLYRRGLHNLAPRSEAKEGERAALEQIAANHRIYRSRKGTKFHNEFDGKPVISPERLEEILEPGDREGKSESSDTLSSDQ